MAEESGGSVAGTKKDPLKFLGKNKGLVIGILAVIAVLVFFFVSRSNKALDGGSNAVTGTSSSGMSPSDLSGLMGALQTIPQGPAGPAGPAGATGKTGKTGPRGKRGPRGPKGKTVRGKPHRHPKKKHSPPEGQPRITARPGDSLRSIAMQYGHNVDDLRMLNAHALGSTGVVHPGMRIQL